MIGTPPPKIWWLPPSGLRACLRNALRSVEIPVVSKPFLMFPDKLSSVVSLL